MSPAIAAPQRSDPKTLTRRRRLACRKLPSGQPVQPADQLRARRAHDIYVTLSAICSGTQADQTNTPGSKITPHGNLHASMRYASDAAQARERGAPGDGALEWSASTRHYQQPNSRASEAKSVTSSGSQRRRQSSQKPSAHVVAAAVPESAAFCLLAAFVPAYISFPRFLARFGSSCNPTSTPAIKHLRSVHGEPLYRTLAPQSTDSSHYWLGLRASIDPASYISDVNARPNRTTERAGRAPDRIWKLHLVAILARLTASGAAASPVADNQAVLSPATLSSMAPRGRASPMLGDSHPRLARAIGTNASRRSDRVHRAMPPVLQDACS